MVKSDLANTRSVQTYRWVWVWLALGVVFALLLLANSIRDYFFVARIITIQQVRQRVGQHITTFGRDLLEMENAPSNDQLTKILSAEFATGQSQPLWILMEGPDGKEVGRAGAQLHQTFTRSQEDDHFRNRQPLYSVVSTPAGEAVVEAFPVRVRTRRPPGDQPPPDAERRGPLSVEVAMPLRLADPAGLWPIRRNLIINSAAAFALLLTVALTAIGFRSYVRRERLERQLDVARQVQEDLLPKQVHLDSAQVAAEYKPADEVAGDFYDVFETEKGPAFVIGDVSGKGVPAALLMGVIHGAVRSSRWWESQASHERETADLNHLLCERISEERFATMFWSYAGSKGLHYVNAGHPPPMLVRLRNGKPEVKRLDVGGPALGVLSDAVYRQGHVDMEPEDLMLLYSDGLVEATNSAGEEFGEARLAAALAAHSVGEDPQRIRDSILLAVHTFLGDKAPHDDLTCVVVRFANQRTADQPLDQRYSAA